MQHNPKHAALVCQIEIVHFTLSMHAKYFKDIKVCQKNIKNCLWLKFAFGFTLNSSIVYPLFFESVNLIQNCETVDSFLLLTGDICVGDCRLEANSFPFPSAL
jgi:hypothetical protein